MATGSPSPPPSRHDSLDDGAPPRSPSWVAERLGVSTATLLQWHRRYGLAPSGRTAGGRRRYSGADVERLEDMCRLIADGTPAGRAARQSHPRSSVHGRQQPPPGGAAASVRHVELLTRAALRLDQQATSEIVAEVLATHGVVAGWTDVLAPALRLRGERFARTADGINVEHLLSECTRAGLSALAWWPRRRIATRPVLLAAPEGEQHVLALYALAAALAEENHPHILLGASVPPRALLDSTIRLDPMTVFLWSQTPGTATVPGPTPIRGHDHLPPVLVLGGPGWVERATGLVTTLAEALRACTVPTRPLPNELPPTPDPLGIAS